MPAKIVLESNCRHEMFSCSTFVHYSTQRRVSDIVIWKIYTFCAFFPFDIVDHRKLTMDFFYLRLPYIHTRQ